MGDKTEATNHKISRFCPCCGLDVRDPTHLKTAILPWMIINAVKAQRAEFGNINLNFDDKAFIVYDFDHQRAHNQIHEILKLDGLDGGPRVDNFNQLVAFLGWGTLTDIMDMLKRIIQYEDFFRLINYVNPTPSEEIDLTDLITVIRDSGWDFYERLSHIKGSEIIDKDGQLVPERFSEFARPIFVRGHTRVRDFPSRHISAIMFPKRSSSILNVGRIFSNRWEVCPISTVSWLTSNFYTKIIRNGRNSGGKPTSA